MIKSILKPTIPLSPPKEIPPHNKTQLPESQSTPEPLQANGEEGERHAELDATSVIGNSTASVPSFEEQQRAAAREKEKQNIIERRDARRKSLG